jgi:TP901 family phage tail tape measure protein
MAVQTSKLIVQLLDRLTGPAKVVSASITRLTAASQANAAKMAAMRGKLLDAAGAGYVLYKGLAAPVKAAMAFESSMADIKKVVDAPSPDFFKKMGRDIRDLSTRLPMAADQIAQIVAAAGQSGLANNELLTFAEMATKVAVAWDVTAGEAGDALAKLKTALGLTVPQAGLLADALNYLSNKTAASAPDLLDFTKRVAPMASQFGLTATQASAFGAAMVGAGFESNVAATSFMNMGRALTKGGSATKRQQAAFNALGLSSTKVAKSMQKDAVGTIQNVLARIRKVPAAMRASLISDLFGDEARALGPLITNAKLLGDTLGYVADKTQYAGSAQAEYDQRSKTTTNALQLFKNRVNDLGISIGDALIPGLNALLDRIGPIVTSISNLAQRFPQATNAIVALTAGVVGFRVAAIGAQFAGLFMKQAFLDLGLTALRSAGMVVGLLNPLRLVTNAMRILKLAVIGTGIGAALVGIAAAGTWIYENWSGISTAFEAFKGAFSRAIAPIKPALQPVIDTISWLWDTVSGLLGPIDEMGGGWARAGLAAGEFVGNVVRSIIELPGKIIALAGQFVEAGAALMRSLFEGVKAVMAEIVAYIKSSLSNAFASVKSGASNLLNKVTFGLAGTASGTDGQRAGGGPVRAGGTYLVGERGPELVTFPQAGFVHDALKTARMMRNAALASAVALPAAAAPSTPPFQGSAGPAAQSRQAPNINVGGIRIEVHGAPGQSPEQVAASVERILSAKLNLLMSGHFADTSTSSI